MQQELERVQWGEFKVGDLFESSNGDYDIQKHHMNGLGDYVITAGVNESGILGKTDVNARVFDAKTITIDMFGNAFYRNFPYKMVTHARVFSLKAKFFMSNYLGIFLSNSFCNLKNTFGYEKMCSFSKIQSNTISLPITPSGKIDYAFMETFIAAVHKKHVKNICDYFFELQNKYNEALNAILHK